MAVPPAPQSANGPERPRRRFGLIVRPLVQFLHTEAASGVILLVCTVVALAWANSPWAASYHALLHTHLHIGVGPYGLDKPLEWWINDGLMTIFFLVVGLEIKRELVRGELRDPRKAALPVAAALGGMLVPALIYYSLRHGGEGERGWGIPMATDIAFVVGVLALLGPRVPGGLKILLLSLAIVDDLGAVLVIAVAYSGSPSLSALALAAGGLVLIGLLRFCRVRRFVVYGLIGVVVWLATYFSGVHPTVAGVLLGFLTPARGPTGRGRLIEVLDVVRDQLSNDPTNDDLTRHSDEVRTLVRYGESGLSALDRLEQALHGWVAFGIMPLFALANAGVAVQPRYVMHPVALAVTAGLLFGKPIGIFSFSWLAVRLGLCRLPNGVDTKVLFGAGCLAGIGFTMSLFIANLGLEGELLSIGKVGTLTGSLLSAVIGVGVLYRFLPPRPGKDEG